MSPHLPARHFRQTTPRLLLAALAAGTLLTGVTASAVAQTHPQTSSSGDHARSGRVVHLPVAFQVKNVNRSKVGCYSDGKTYTVRGNLVAPASALASRPEARSVTLYLHGLSFGEFFWNFNAVEGYNYADNQARAGLTSLVVDRLGYGRSGKPAGTAICAGSRADIAHQLVLALRSGHYSTAHTKSATFDQVVLAGHSYGGQIAQIEAYSFGDIDGLIVISYTDLGQSALLRKNGKYAAKVCARGGLPVTPGGPTGYAPFGPPSKAPAALFHSVDPRVLRAAVPKLTIDPCGDTASFAKATAVDIANVGSIKVPVLLISGASDALFPPPALQRQAGLYTGTRQFNLVTVPRTAHAITLERTHHLFEHAVATWLRHYSSGSGPDSDD